MSDQKWSPRALWRLGFGAALLALAVLYPTTATGFQQFQVSMALVYATALVGLMLLTGLSGQISLGHAAFFGVGAYTCAILIRDHGVPYPLAILAAGAIGAALGALIGLPALRLRGLYLAILTLGLAVTLPYLIRRFDGITGGAKGINLSSGVANPPGFVDLSKDTYLYLVACLVASAVVTVAWLIVRGPIGRTLIAVRDNEIAARCMGINIAHVKVAVFSVSSLFAAVAGALYAILIGYIAPGSFLVMVSIMMLAALVVGGAGSLAGAVLGGFFMQFAPHYTYELNPAAAGLAYGLLLIVLMLVMPSGLVGGASQLRSFVSKRRGSGAL